MVIKLGLNQPSSEMKSMIADLPRTIYSDDEVEFDSDEEHQVSRTAVDFNPDIGTFFKDFYLVKDYGNFNDSLGKAISVIKNKAKPAKANRSNYRRQEEKPFEYTLKHDNENPDELEAIYKYEYKSQPDDLDSIINKVLMQSKRKSNKKVDPELSDGSDADEESESFKQLVNSDGTSDAVKMRLKDKTKKEKKMLRKEKQLEETLEKDKEELQFEDAPPADPNLLFKDMGLSPNVLKAIKSMHYKKPMPVQAATIPIALKGRDICGCAATGTGKTAAFMLPILERLIFKPDKSSVTRVLVLVPTRELGVQVFEVSKDLSQFVDASISLIVGGLDMKKQGTVLKSNPDIIIATPGRLIDHIHNTPSFTLAEIEILVLDEADRMLDENFSEQIMEIVGQCCIKRQTLLFSATLTSGVKDLVSMSLQKPVRVFVSNINNLAQNLRQEFIRMKKNPDQLRPAILAYLASSLVKDQCIVFVALKSACHKLNVMLSLLGLKCAELHGGLKQFQRLTALQKFRDKKVDILLATDVAARGLDIPGVAIVINYNLPCKYDSYIHRVGRTARAGMSGTSITISSELGKDHQMLRTIQKNSTTPLFERVVTAAKLSYFSKKVEDVTPLVESVFEMEKEYKKNPASRPKAKVVEKKPAEIVIKSDEVQQVNLQKGKTAMWNNRAIGISQLQEEIKKREENLKQYSAGIPPSERRETRKRKLELKEKAKEIRKKAKERLEIRNKALEKEQRKNDGGKGAKSLKRKSDSNFEEELTRTDEKYVKKLRKGPSYLEKKEMFEAKNPGDKFSMKGKSSNYTGADTSSFDNIGGPVPRSHKAMQKYFELEEKDEITDEKWYKKRRFRKNKDSSTFSGTKSLMNKDKRKGKRK